MGIVRRYLLMSLVVIAAAVMTGCSSTRHVPPGRYLLDEVKIEVHDTTKTLTSKGMMSYVRQRPNNRTLHLVRMRLGIYNISGKDSTKWWNKWMRRLGEAPVIYDRRNMEMDSSQLLRAMNNAGFLESTVRIDTTVNKKGNKIKLKYYLEAGQPHVINSITYQFPSDTMRRVIMQDSADFPVKEGQRLDREQLEAQREMIISRMRNRGYWAFTKEFVTYNADTTSGSKQVDLTMIVHPPYPEERRKIDIDTHREYTIRRVIVITDYDGAITSDPRQYVARDTVDYKGMLLLYGDRKKKYLRPSAIYDCSYLKAGELYRKRDVDKTYETLGRMSIIKFTQIRLFQTSDPGDDGGLDAYILLTPNRSQNVSLEVEGTNSEGDFGVALGVNYTHRNAGRGSEMFNLKLRGSYEALNGQLDGLLHNRFLQLDVETSLTFPKFKAPFLRESFKKKIKASTELKLSMSYQERPEYTRIISTVGWSYKWSEQDSHKRYTLTPIDINYVYLPQSTNGFLDEIAPDNPLLRYSYEDHFIMRLGFNFYYTNKRRESGRVRQIEKDIFTVRAQAETAGNLLFGISRAVNPHRGFHENPYKVFGIRYSQYVRADADFTYLHTFDRRNSLACYVGLGVGMPYGNSSILPFEKRFYGGGANGVRGWAVRTLGPGRFPGNNAVSNFIYQCGDIRFNMSMEYRAKLFWVVEGALFLDAGNIWTIRSYDTQPYGVFRFDQFYKELAASYGVGIRLDFTYFLVRFDLGMKAHDPAIGGEPWPLIHPHWKRDSSFHFSIGYPF